jgi:ATP-binding cassette, subfamily B, bacterial
MKSLRPLFSYIKPYRWKMLLVILSALVMTSTTLISPLIIREVIRDLRIPGQLPAIQGFALTLFVLFLLRAAGQYAKNYMAHIVAWNIVSDVQAAVYEHLQTLTPRFYTNRQTGELVSRVTSDTRDIEPILAHSIPDAIVYSTLIIGVYLVLFVLNPTLALFVLLPTPFLVYIVRRFVSGEHQGFIRALQSLGLFHAKVQDNLSGMREIQIFAQEQREAQQVRQLAKASTDERLIALKLQALIPSAVELAAGVGTLLVIGFGGQLALEGKLPVEDLLAFILYLGLLYEPIRILAYTNEGLQTSLAGAQRIAELLGTETDIADSSGITAPQKLEGAVKFEHLHFGYSNETPVLKDISLSIAPGQTMALVGPTGAGKTTLTSLLARFYDPQQGKVELDGIDIRELPLKSLRHNISMVLQDVFLFSGTVRENIRFSKPDASDEEVVQAARIARAHDFIMSLPKGYDTQIGERGLKLSGGQKQRLAIARAVLKDAPILILDEATSSVDVQTEADIQEALLSLMKGRTSIVIAHRLSTVRNADLIAVIDEGQVREAGKHDELIAFSGMYRSLYETQFKTAS